MKKWILLIMMAIPSLSFSQEENQKMFSLSWGAGHLMRQDIIFSPFIHSDFSAAHVALEYERQRQWVQNIEVSFSAFNPTLTEGTYFEHGEEKTLHPHSFSFISVYYGLGKQLTGNEKPAIKAGGFFNPDIQVLNYVYGRTGPYFGYVASFGLGIFATVDYQITPMNRLNAEIRLPVASWITRSPYLVNDDEFIENTSSHNTFKTFLAFIGDGKPASWNKWQQAEFTMQYHRRLLNKVSAGVGYGFYFLHHAEPRNLLSFENYFTLHVHYHF